jgi:hypothetical protein
MSSFFTELLACPRMVPPSPTLEYIRRKMEKLGLIDASYSGAFAGVLLKLRAIKRLTVRLPTDFNDLQGWNAKERHELSKYEESCKIVNAWPEPERTLALRKARDKLSEFWAQRPGCSNDLRCSAQTPCGNAGCKYTPLNTSTTGLSHPQDAASGATIRDSDSPHLAATSARALPDPGTALSGPAQIPNTAGTNPPSAVNPPGIATVPALQGTTTAPQAAPQASADRLTVWKTTGGLMRMFAKSKNKTLIMTALLFLLILQFRGMSLL